jgi:hypothetical protein
MREAVRLLDTTPAAKKNTDAALTRSHEQVLTYMILIGVRSAVAPDFNGGPVPP